MTKYKPCKYAIKAQCYEIPVMKINYNCSRILVLYILEKNEAEFIDLLKSIGWYDKINNELFTVKELILLMDFHIRIIDTPFDITRIKHLHFKK